MTLTDQALKERLGTAFTDEDRQFFDKIKVRATSNNQVIQTAMAENDKIVTRYMDDGDFQRTAIPILAKEIFEAVHASQKPVGYGT